MHTCSPYMLVRRAVHCVEQFIQVCLVYVKSKSPVFCPEE
jgi:hypothetical protein